MPFLYYIKQHYFVNAESQSKYYIQMYVTVYMEGNYLYAAQI